MVFSFSPPPLSHGSATMPAPLSPDERKAFILFLLLTLSTFLVFAFMIVPPFITGLLGIGWGFLGLSRFLPLSVTADPTTTTHTSPLLSLPVRLLSRLAQKDTRIRHLVKTRFQQTDILILSGLIIAFVIWNIYTSLFPHPFSTMQNLWNHQALFFTGGVAAAFTLQNIILFAIHLMILLISGALALSFGHSKRLFNGGITLLLPVLGMVFIGNFFVTHLAAPLLLPDTSVMTGGGWLQGNILPLLAPDFAHHSGTPLIIRFIHIGFTGIALLYAGALLAMVYLIRAFFAPLRSKIPAITGLGCLTLLLLADIAFIQTPLVNAAQFLAFIILIFCLGRTGYNSK